jgi:hypothetical protein
VPRFFRLATMPLYRLAACTEGEDAVSAPLAPRVPTAALTSAQIASPRSTSSALVSAVVVAVAVGVDSGESLPPPQPATSKAQRDKAAISVRRGLKGAAKVAERKDAYARS